MLTVCAYLGTIQGEKLNEPEPDLSPICKKKKNGPNPARMDSACRAPSGSDGLAGLYCVGLCLCEEWYAKYNRHNDRKSMFDCNVYSQFTLLNAQS